MQTDHPQPEAAATPDEDTRMSSSTPTSTIDAEWCLVGCALAEGRLSDDCQQVVPEDFRSATLGAIWGTLVRLARKGRHLSAQLAAVEGHHLLDDLDLVLQHAPLTGTADDYAPTVRRDARRRAYLAALQSGLYETEHAGDADAVAIQVADEIFRIAEDRAEERPVHIKTVLGDVIADLETRMRTREVMGVPTGIESIDALIVGMERGGITLLAGGTGSGKSSLALQIVLTVAKRGASSMIFSLEMSNTSIGQRAIAQETMTPLRALIRATLSESDYARIGTGIHRLADAPVFMVDRTLPIDQLEATARRHHARHGLDFLCVDYLQLVPGESRRGRNREQEVASVSRGLKQLAMDLKIPVLALSQLNREGARQQRPPALHDLRESGSLEQDASHVIAVYRPDPETDGAKAIVLKNRQGPLGTVSLDWRGRYVRFLDAQR